LKSVYLIMVATSQLQNTALTNSSFGIGGTMQTYEWRYEDKVYSIAYEVRGQGTPVLLLPALSTVSTREEMRDIAEVLSTQFQVYAMDWLGFGESDRPNLDYRTEILHHLLQDFVQATFSEPIAVVAAGHAAGYVMRVATQLHWSRIVLVAPTWRGPLPTMGADPQVGATVRGLVRSPLLGQALYQLNTAPAFLKFMYRRHVYTDQSKLTSEFMGHKYKITQRSGARFAPVAFVTGNLDPAQNRTEFLSYFHTLSNPVLVIIGEQAPDASKAEMEALADLPVVQIKRLPGSLGLHEEYGTEVAALVLPFLAAIGQ
jgi:pimeloyl-ACP methyl ester carboxylesterase